MAEKLTNEQIIDTLKQMTALELKALVDAVCAEFGGTFNGFRNCKYDNRRQMIITAVFCFNLIDRFYKI